MKHTCLLLTLIAAGTLRAETMDVEWDKLCAVAHGRQIEVQTQNGETVHGFCSSVSATGVTVYGPGGKAVIVAREALSKVQMHRAKSGQLKSLGRGFRRGMGGSLALVFSPHAVLGLVAVPVVAAWGVTALPFCALGDLGAKMAGRVELRPI